MRGAGVSDASYRDGAERALALVAQDADDLAVISALVQDAVFPATEMRFRKGQRAFALLLNRFRWEDREFADREARGYERVQAVLSFGDVLSVQTQGPVREGSDTVCSLLSVGFEPREDGMGRVTLVLAGDGAVALEVEALDVTLRDVTRPYLAQAKAAPGHGESPE